MTHRRSIEANVRGAGLTWKQKQELRERRMRMKALDAEIKKAREEEEAARKERRKQSIIRKKQNIAKNTVVQQITDKKKIRHMTKKQYRQLRQFHFDEIE